MPRRQQHQALRKIACRRRRTGGANGIALHFALPLNLERMRHPILPGEHIQTGRETEVLYHIARGDTDREVTEMLFVSRRSIERHVESILARLEVKNRREAAALGASRRASQALSA